MSAKEMFEELGYEQEKIGEQLIYSKINEKTEVEYQFIFYLDDKTFEAATDSSVYVNDINMQELQAINKQVEELGWNEE